MSDRDQSGVPMTEADPPHTRRREADWTHRLKVTWTVIGWVVLAVAALWLLGRLWTVLLPLLLGLTIVFFLRPPVEWLVDRGLPRLLAVSACYLLALLVIGGAGFYLAPAIVQQTNDLVSGIPEFLEEVQASAEARRDRYEDTVPAWLFDGVADAVESAVNEIGSIASILGGGLLMVGSRIFAIATGVLTGFVISFYLLYSLPRVGPGILDAMPPGWRRDMRDLGGRIEDTVGGFIRGQVILMISVGIMTWLGMLLIGMPYAVLIGVLAGFLDAVPYVGPLGAGVLAIAIGLATDPILALWGVIVLVVVQQIEGNIIRPKVMSDAVGIHPVVVILVIIGATTLFGFMGLILAVPVLAVAKVVYEFYAEKRGWDPW